MRFSNIYFLLTIILIVIFSCTPEVTVTCDDGILNGDEIGIDCGGVDCPACISCFDNIQNGNETGIDCGGDCNPCSTCNDGILNGTETGIDCGGNICPPCGILGCTNSNAHNYDANATEDDGSCETCTDGIMNGDETDVDCGGILCGTCDVLGCTDQDAHNYNMNATIDDGSCETCADGIVNGDETGLDCGGGLCLPCYEIGNAGPGGGVVFYDKGNYDNNWRYMETGADIQGTDETWGCYDKYINETSLAIGQGFENTQAIILFHLSTPCNESPVAAMQCLEFNGGGFSDWYLPSVNELKEMFLIKSQLGINSGRYWSSTESNPEDAYLVDFAASSVDVSSYTFYKNPVGGQQGNARIKPVRRF